MEYRVSPLLAIALILLAGSPISVHAQEEKLALSPPLSQVFPLTTTAEGIRLKYPVLLNDRTILKPDAILRFVYLAMAIIMAVAVVVAAVLRTVMTPGARMHAVRPAQAPPTPRLRRNRKATARIPRLRFKPKSGPRPLFSTMHSTKPLKPAPPWFI
jgi:hypothetical protein